MDREITLAHGNGGRRMRELIEQQFQTWLANPHLEIHSDSARLPLHGSSEASLYITTDGFTVKPLEFPGGDIGSLAIHGTVNDLAVVGATPHYLTLNAFIEEGLAIATLQRLLQSMAAAAQAAGVAIVAGDTKVVPRGEGSGVYFATTGIGSRPHHRQLGIHRVRAGDQLLVSGSLGDHGTAVLLAREQFGLYGDLQSDSASVLPLAQAVWDQPGLKWMSDPTRGGLATLCHELAAQSGLSIRLEEAVIPIQEAVATVCALLGYDPLYLACEGRIVAVADPETAPQIIAQWRQLENGQASAIMGELVATPASQLPAVTLTTPLGGERYLEPLDEDPLPRIC